MRSASLFNVVASSVMFAIAGPAGAQASNQAPNPPPDPPASGTNRVQLTSGIVFNAFGDGSEHMRKMRERLQDPQQRAALREEHRGHIVDSHHDALEVLELDAATYGKLIELLTDQQMAQLDEFHLRGASQAPSPDMTHHLQFHADRQNREIDTLRELLGQDKLERYQAYRTTLGERWQVREFDTYLAPGDKLNSKQKQQLVEVFRDHFQRLRLGHQSLGRLRSGLSAPLGVPGEMPSREELQRRSQLMTIESNEVAWRRMPESDREFREQAAAFLTATQLATLERMHTEKSQQFQRSIEQMRLQAGLNPTIPPEAESEEPAPPAKVTRDVRVRIKIAVNQANPAMFTEVIRSGTPFTFEADGLLVQATPTVYDNGTYDLRVEYFEQGATGKRAIGHMGSMGTLSRTPPSGEALASMGGSSTVLSGNKAYAIQLNTSVEGT